MTPPGKMAEEYPGWSAVAKLAIGIIGATLTVVGTLVASAAEKQAKALEELKAAVYAGQKDNAVLDNRVTTVEHGLAETKDRVKVLESRLFKEK